VFALLDVPEASPELDDEKLPPHFEGYRKLRERQSSSSLCHALVAACTYVAQYAPELRLEHAPTVELVRAQLAGLTPETIERIRDRDERRVRAALGFFQGWWSELTAEANSPRLQLDFILSSRFYELLMRESVLVRFTLEAELLSALFPGCADASRAMVADIAAFRDRVQTHLHELMREQALSNRREASARE
jgi:hypothetical protein